VYDRFADPGRCGMRYPQLMGVVHRFIHKILAQIQPCG
jgi:hypothetical protein